MDVTFHGTKRVFSRTKMRLEDVLSVVKNNAAVELGRAGNLIYFLFYSPPDNCTKIALVSEDKHLLVSVWENDYRLPKGVGIVNWKLKHEAKRLLRSFLISRSGINKINDNSRVLHVFIDVYEGEKVVYTHKAIEIREGDTKSVKSTLAVTQFEIAKIAKIVQENINLSEGRVRYCFRISDPETHRTIKQPFLLDHKQIMERLAKAT